MFVGVDLESVARSKGPRMKANLGKPTNFMATGSFDPISSGQPMRRSHSFTPPSSRLTQPTMSQQRRNDLTAPSPFAGGSSARGGSKSARSGSKSARNSTGKPAPGTSAAPDAPAAPDTPGTPAAPADSMAHASARLASARRASGGTPGFFGTPGSSGRPSRQSSYTGKVPLHAQTHSPSGRYHPDPQRRREIRACDITANIDYYSPWGAPDNDRKMKEASWLCSQAFIESLRVYPDPKGPKSPISLPGEEIAFSGNTNSARRTCREHVETATRRRLGIAPADADWLPDQLPKEWPDRVPEGTWRAVGNGLSLLGSGPGGSGLFGKLFKGGKVGSPASRAAAAAAVAASSQDGSVFGSARGSARGSALGSTRRESLHDGGALFDR